MASSVCNKPFINVTPLIDVLLVVLIIFMVAAPLRPYRFAAKLPSKPDDRALPPNINTLVVTIEPDRTLKLNGLSDMGTVDDCSKLSAALVSLFAERKINRAYRAEIVRRAIDFYGNDFVQLKGLGFTCTLEKLLKLHLLGARFAEVPFTLRYDQKVGLSKMVSSITTLGYLVMLINYYWPWGGWRRMYRRRLLQLSTSS